MKFRYTMSLLILIIFGIAGCGNQDNTLSDISTTHSASSTESHASIAGLAEDENVLMPVSDANREIVSSSEHYTILGNDAIQANKIISVTFLDSLTNTPEDAWDVSEAGDSSVMAWVIEDEEIRLNDEPACHLYIAGEGGVNANSDSSYLFFRYTNVKSIDFNGCFYTQNATDMSYMFASTTSMTSIDLTGFDTSRVTDMKWMFSGSLIEELNLNEFDTSNVTDMSDMFAVCDRLSSLDISGFNTSNVRNMSNMFYFCESLQDLNLAGIDTSSVIDMSHMFSYCYVLTNLDIGGFDTANVTNMYGMFEYCTGLKTLDLSGFDTSMVTNMCSMFEGCTSLEVLNLSSFDTSIVTDMRYMFQDCANLKDLRIAGFNMSQAKTDDMFTGAGVSGNTDILGAVLVFVCTWQFLLAAALALLAAVVIFIIIIRKRRAKQ